MRWWKQHKQMHLAEAMGPILDVLYPGAPKLTVDGEQKYEPTELQTSFDTFDQKRMQRNTKANHEKKRTSKTQVSVPRRAKTSPGGAFQAHLELSMATQEAAASAI